MPDNNAFDAQTRLDTSADEVTIHSLKRLDEKVEGDVFSLPFSIRVILEWPLLNCGGRFVAEGDVKALAPGPQSLILRRCGARCGRSGEIRGRSTPSSRPTSS